LYPRLFAATRGTPDEIFCRARQAWSPRDAKAAIEMLREIAKPRPSDPRYHHQLLAWLRDGDANAYDEQFSDSANRIHTTAEGMLRIAWRSIDRGAYDSASAALTRALALDPTDPRIYLYAGIVADEQSLTGERAFAGEAAASYRAGLAMEETRLRRLGRGLSEGTARLGPDDWPLSAVVALRLANLLSRSGRDREAVDFLASMSRGLQGRVDLPDPSVTAPEKMALPAGQLPGAKDEAKAPPPHALLAWMHVASGNILRRGGRKEDAGAAYAAALALNRGGVRPLESYNRDEKALLAEARTLVPPRILPRFDMAVTLAQEGAIECGTVKDPRKIFEEQQAAKEKQYQAAGDIDKEYLRRSLGINTDFATKSRALGRFDTEGRKALQEEMRKKQQELQDWREQEMKKLYGPGYR
ncbi:MAG: hypothetical protein AAB728_00485, partial [Patescibacteria group bacterium]